MTSFGDLPAPVALAPAEPSFVEELFAFYRRAGFLYPEKAARLEPHWAEISANLVAAMRGPDPLAYVYVSRDASGRIVATNSATRYTDDCWWGHSTVSDGDAGGLMAVSLAITRHLSTLPSCRFAKLGWRPSNPWPERFYGRLPKALGPGNYHLETHDYSVFDHAQVRAATGRTTDAPAMTLVALSGLSGRAYDDAAGQVEAGLRRMDQGFLARSENLEPRTLLLPAAAAAYRARGLTRGREVLVAMSRGEALAAAVLDRGPLGLHLSFGLDKFRVFLLSDPATSATQTAAAVQALTLAACEQDANRGRTFSIGHLTPEVRALLGAVPHTVTKQYRQLVMSVSPREQPVYEQHFRALFALAQIFTGAPRAPVPAA